MGGRRATKTRDGFAQAPATARLFEAATNFHRQGRLDEATQLYRATLARDGNNVLALHHLGIILADQGRLEEAVALMRRALERNARFAELHNNLGIALHTLGRAAEAITHYETALAIKPDFAAAHNNLGNALQILGRPVEAVPHYERALAINPDYAEAHGNLGGALRALDRVDAAIACFRRALALKPDYPHAHKNLGNALQALGRSEEAIAHYRQAIALKPGFAEVHNDLGNALQAQGRHEDALACYQKALAAKPTFAHAHYNLGNALQALKRYEAALGCYARALALKPDYAKAHNNSGTALNALGRYEEAIQHYEQALAIDARFAGAHNNLGNALQALNRPVAAMAHYEIALGIDAKYAEAHSNMGHALHALNRHREALDYYRRAVELKPDYADAHWNEALARLALGDFPGGWRKYEWRWRNRNLGLAQRVQPRPLWLGREEIAGKTILLHAEQGLGDTLQFLRFVPLVQSRGARVVLEVQKPLLPLLADFPGVAAVRARGEKLPEFDLHCPLMSLPLALGATLETLPAATPYLAATAEKTAEWRSRLRASDGPRIGLAWSGNTAHKNDHNRSLPLTTLRPLLEPGAGRSFVAVQKELRPADAAAIGEFPDLQFLGEQLTDFSDTAAVVANLDLVITVDTSLAHLAGAMGKPVWILLPFSADWRWLVDRADSPWYPTARLFRQPAIGDWASVVRDVANRRPGLAPCGRTPKSKRDKSGTGDKHVPISALLAREWPHQ